jgi:hypothetical protein
VLLASLLVVAPHAVSSSPAFRGRAGTRSFSTTTVPLRALEFWKIRRSAPAHARAIVPLAPTRGYLRAPPTMSRFRPFAVPNLSAAIDDANWIMGAVVASGPMRGAIANYPDAQPTHIRPYQAGYAALGLARATQLTGDYAFVRAAWNWLDWYQAHMDNLNYVHDWDLVNGTWQVGGYDSTDAYAGMFLCDALAAYTVDPNIFRLDKIHTGVARAFQAIRSTQRSDGLTWALPSGYPVKLLENNAEALAGVKAAIRLATLLGDTALASAARGSLLTMTGGLASLWNGTDSYYWAFHDDGSKQPTDWSVLAPDTMAQGWAVSFGVTAGSRAVTLLRHIDTAQPNWDRPGLTGNYDTVPIGWGYAVNGARSRALTAASNYRSAVMAHDRAWPFTPSAAGSLIVLETNGEDTLGLPL